MDLFEHARQQNSSPLAFRMRPRLLEDFIGGNRLYQKYTFLKKEPLPSILLWGPPGSGKTTLAGILGQRRATATYEFNGVMGNTADLKKLMSQMDEECWSAGKASFLFVDEIHRLHKAQQDALLPILESGKVILVGATTENPHVCLNKALLSRLQVVEMQKWDREDLLILLQKANEFIAGGALPLGALEMVANSCGGDARKALNFLEILSEDQAEAARSSRPFGASEWEKHRAHFIKQSHEYDKNRDRHYDVISAFIKSMRGSDPDAACLWLAVMLEGGEDPFFVARRCMIFAAEDVGNADPRALQLATSGVLAVEKIGMPEARIILAQVVTYLASTVKSNAAYLAINEAQQFLTEEPLQEVPEHLRGNGSQRKNYLYPHDYPQQFVPQEYRPTSAAGNKRFYRPKDVGQEKFFKERLEKLWGSQT